MVPKAQNPTLLYIEKDNEILQANVEKLKPYFEEIIALSSPQKAQDEYQKYKIDILLTDIYASKNIDGIRLAQEMREKDENLMIVINSDLPTTKDFLNIIPLKIESYLAKPLDIDRFIKICANYKKNPLSQNELILQNILHATLKTLLSQNERKILEYILSKSNIHNIFYGTMDGIAKDLKLNKITVLKAIEKFKNARIVSMQKNGRYEVNCKISIESLT